MLKMSLNEIKGKIQIYPENWVNMYSTNCYAYALGLDVRENDICIGAYNPGIISGTSSLNGTEYFEYEALINGIAGDLKALDIEYHEVNPMEKIKINEWKIALLTEKYHDKLMDFHFLRQNKSGLWSHKNGFNGIISKKDYLGRIIADPSVSELTPYTYEKCYALKINR